MAKDPNCMAHHICQCNADKIAELETAKRSLTRKLKKLEKLVPDVEAAQLFVKDAQELIETLSSRHCPFVEH